MSEGKKGIAYHFKILTKDLEKSGGPFICGSEYTLADISMIPIFDRMEYGKWWTNSLKEKFPIVLKYWENIQQRKSYQSSRPDQVMHKKMMENGKIIDQWKNKYKWFNDFYEN